MSLNGRLEKADREVTAASLRTAELVAPTWLFFSTEEEAAEARRRGLIPAGCKLYIGLDVMGLV